MKKEIGQRIRKIRESMYLTKDAFAKEIGITGQYLGLIEHGQNYLSIEKLKILCDFTGLSADYILFGKDLNVIKSTKEMLTEFSDEQLISACTALKYLALYLKSNNDSK